MPEAVSHGKLARALGLPAGFAALVAGRLVTNIGIRLVFPFLPQVARGLGTTVDTMGSTLAVSQVAALGQLGLGRVVHRIGVRAGLVGGLAALALVCTVAAMATSVVWFGACLAAVLLTKGLYDVSSWSWIGDQVPPSRRGRAVGVIEMSWAGAFVVGMPLAALVIRLGTWRTPYLLVAVACVIAAATLAAVVPAVGRHEAPPRAALRPSRRVVLALATPFLFSVALYALLVSFAAWLEDTHGVSIEGLGLAALAVGLGELGGSSTCAMLADRFGSIPTLRVGLGLLVPVSLALPLGSAALPVALVMLFAWFGLFEFSYVTLLSWLTELQPDARATIASLTFASFSGGGLVGSLVGSRLFDGPGIAAVTTLAATLFAAALVLSAEFRAPGPAVES